MEKLTNVNDVYRALENGVNLDYMEFRSILTENATHIYVIHDLKKQCFGDYEITGVIIKYAFELQSNFYTIEIDTRDDVIRICNDSTFERDYTRLPYNMAAEIENAISLIATDG